MKRKFTFLLAFILLCVLFIAASGSAGAASPGVSPYIIVFKDTVNPAANAAALARAYGLQPGFVYSHALKGMSALVPAGKMNALAHDPRVAYVVEDMQRGIDAQTVPTGIQRIFADTNTNIAIDGTDDYRVDVDVAVIDTGIDLQHPDLNVVKGVNCIETIFNAVCVPGGDDDHYHGTHVAGTIGAIDNDQGVVGVAPGARLYAVKVLNNKGRGWTSWIVAGIDWVTANADVIEVANMSLGGSGFNQAEYDAIQGAVAAGVAFAVAAGNNDDDANNYSPGGFDNVLSVSALADFDGVPGGNGNPTCRNDQDDTLADFSNWGPEVDITAPGVCILSTYPLERGGYDIISGTSMASPHVAGALALLASRNNPNGAADVQALYSQVLSTGNDNWTDDSGDGIQEPLLDVSNTGVFNPVLVPGSGGGGETNQPPTASFNYTTSDLTATFTDMSTDLDGTIASWSWEFGDGSTSTDQSPSHIYAADNTYTVSLTVTDNQGASDVTSESVTVSSSGGSGTVSVASLVGSSIPMNKNFWRATVSATINPALSGAVVSGVWEGGSSASCTTDSNGQCAVSTNVRTKDGLKKITFTVSDVALTGYDYVPDVTDVMVDAP